MKIKGRPSPQRIVVKVFHPDKEAYLDFAEIVKRLEKSNVPPSKMQLIFFTDRKQHGILMESYIGNSKEKKGKIESKLKPGFLFWQLDLSKKRDSAIFALSVNATAKLAKTGLYFTQMYTGSSGQKNMSPGPLRVDVFNVMEAKSGQKKILVQDIDSVRLGASSKFSWRNSTNVLLNTVSCRRPENAEIARKIIGKVGKRYRF